MSRIMAALKKFKGEPFLLEETSLSREEIEEAVEAGQLCVVVDHGLYYMPKILLGNAVPLSTNKLIEKVYISDRRSVYGFYAGLTLLNKLQLTTQVPSVVEVVTSRGVEGKTTVFFGKQKCIVRKSEIPITRKNVGLLSLIEVAQDERFIRLNKEKQKGVINKLIPDYLSLPPHIREIVKKLPGIR